MKLARSWHAFGSEVAQPFDKLIVTGTEVFVPSSKETGNG